MGYSFIFNFSWPHEEQFQYSFQIRINEYILIVILLW